MIPDISKSYGTENTGPATVRPDKAISFLGSLLRSYDTAKKTIVSAMRGAGAASEKRAVVIGVGGFASVPAVLAAGRVGVPIAIVNVDIVPGRANKLLGRFARKIFVQFDDTAKHFGKAKDRVVVTGCPLRDGFARCNGEEAIEQFALDADKKTVVVTGASSGSLNINRAVARVLRELDAFAENWQVVHLTGSAANTRRQREESSEVKIAYHLVDYYDDMPGLYGCADLIVGRAGAVSVAEFAASGTPAICLPYPYHKDRHQYLNAQKLVDAGAAVIVDDIPDDNDATAKLLGQRLKELMADDQRRARMAAAAKGVGNISAAAEIAGQLLRF